MNNRPTFAMAILLAATLSLAIAGTLAAQGHDLPPVVQPSSGPALVVPPEKSPAARTPIAIEPSPPPDAQTPVAPAPPVEKSPAEKPKKPVDDFDVKPILEVDPKNPYVARQSEEARPAPVLVREGRRLFDRQGAIVRQGTESVFLFDSGEAPMVLAACKHLERTENLSEFGKRPLKFYISGEVTEYRGRNYLLMSDTPRTTDLGGPAGEALVPPKAGDASRKVEPAVKTPATGQAPRDRNAPPPPADVKIPVAPPPPPPPSARPVPAPSPYRSEGEPGTVAGTPTLLGEDKRLIDREGRLVREGTLDLFVFDNGDTPILLLPNRKLQRMEELCDFGRQPVRFRISGRVTEYRSRNYLAMSKMVVIPKAVEKL